MDKNNERSDSSSDDEESLNMYLYETLNLHRDEDNKVTKKRVSRKKKQTGLKKDRTGNSSVSQESSIPTATKSEELVLNASVGDASTCSSSQMSESFEFQRDFPEESNINVLSSNSNDEADTSSSTIICVDSEPEAYNDEYDESLDLYLQTSNPEVSFEILNCLQKASSRLSSQARQDSNDISLGSRSKLRSSQVSDSETSSTHSGSKSSDTDLEFNVGIPSTPLQRRITEIYIELEELHKINEALIIDRNSSCDSSDVDSGLQSSDIEQDSCSNNQLTNVEIRAREQELLHELQSLLQIVEPPVDSQDTKIVERFDIELEHKSAKSRESSNSNDSHSDEIFDVFKTVVRIHPIKKFEIPPYEYTDAERPADAERPIRPTDENDYSSASCSFSTSNDEVHRNILTGISNVDSHEIMTFEIEDHFCQTSRLLCDSLIKEYLKIASKIKFLLAKRKKDDSTESSDLLMSEIASVDDELGYLIAELMSTINDWEKELEKIRQNMKDGNPSKSNNPGPHHIPVLRACINLGKILLDFSNEKQVDLENYEKLILNPKQN